MTPEEIAMKFASASATCRGGERCPYITNCTGHTEDCRLKEVAMTIRAQSVKIERLEAKCAAMKEYAEALDAYADKMENIAREYESIIKRFQNGYRPSYKLKCRKKPKTGVDTSKIKKVDDLLALDGKERYELPARPKEPKMARVII